MFILQNVAINLSCTMLVSLSGQHYKRLKDQIQSEIYSENVYVLICKPPENADN